MGRINVLGFDVANLIAAGEVVEWGKRGCVSGERGIGGAFLAIGEKNFLHAHFSDCRGHRGRRPLQSVLYNFSRSSKRSMAAT